MHPQNPSDFHYQISKFKLNLVGNIVDHVGRLDGGHDHEWSELKLRIEGIGKQRSELEAFSDLMP